jgi:hypothetical protein
MKNMTHIDSIAQFRKLQKKLVGKKISAISLVLFRYQNEVRDEDPLLELHLENADVILIRGTNGGENLAYTEEEWTSDTDTPDEELGYLVKVDISSFYPFDNTIRRTVIAVSPLHNPFDKLAGMTIHFDNREQLSYLTAADENFLFLNDMDKVLELGFIQKQ